LSRHRNELLRFWVVGYFLAAGVTDRLWSVEDLVALWEAYEQRRAERRRK